MDYYIRYEDGTTTLLEGDSVQDVLKKCDSSVTCAMPYNEAIEVADVKRKLLEAKLNASIAKEGLDRLYERILKQQFK